MPDISFPSNPAVNDTYTFGGKTWIWTGSYWALNTAGSINGIDIGTITPAAGAFTTLTSSGNTTLGNIAGNVLPAANVTYDLGSSTRRWNDIWLANSTIYIGAANISASGTAIVLPTGTTIGGSIAETPKIGNIQITNSSWTPLDDTAISTDGGYFIVNGTGFQSGATVSADGTNASSVTFVNSTLLRCQIGAKAAASYTVYVINPDGGTALKPSGLTYSGLPAWVTASALANATANTAFTYTLSATGATSYALAPGNTIPTGSTLAANGVFSGNVAVANSTSYSFTVTATDAEQQDADRTFSLNVNVITAPTSVEYLVVAGGGGGGYYYGGGGGAGGYRTGNLNVSSGVAYTVTVGGGGLGWHNSPSRAATNGSDSVFASITSTGGGYGGQNPSTPASNGGSGGGGNGGSVTSKGLGNTPSTSPSQGNDGADGVADTGGGGGGGAGAAASGKNGGNGSTAFDGNTYAGGGGAWHSSGSGTGGSGGGAIAGESGTVNSGGGGGGWLSTPGNGGSGIVIIRYADSFPLAAATTGSPEVTTAGGYRVYKFTGSGSITW